MPFYMVQVAYSVDAWASQVKGSRESMTERLRSVFQKLGGQVSHVYYAFGEYDAIAIGEFPDNISAVSFSAAISAGGAAKAVKTIPLMTEEEGLEAMRRAGGEGW